MNHLFAFAICAAVLAPPGVACAAQDATSRVAPALSGYTAGLLEKDVWQRPGLSRRDRSLVTISALITMGKTQSLDREIARALDNGVTPSEIGGAVTHLAFYAGWPNAMSACEVIDRVFQERKIPASALAPAQVPLYPVPPQDATRANTVRTTVAPISPSLAQLTNGPLFDEIWRREDLKPRDRSLITIVALTANGNAEQLGFHLQRGIENGLSRSELGEVMAHLAFYAGWPKAFSGISAIGKIATAKP